MSVYHQTGAKWLMRLDGKPASFGVDKAIGHTSILYNRFTGGMF